MLVQGAGLGSPAPDWCLVKISGGTGGGRSGLSIFTFLSHPPQTAAAAAPAPLLHLLKRHLREGCLQAASPLASRSPSPLTDSPTQPSEGFGGCEAKAELTCRVRSTAGRGQAPNLHRCPRDGSPGPPKTSPPGTRSQTGAGVLAARREVLSPSFDPKCLPPGLAPARPAPGWAVRPPGTPGLLSLAPCRPSTAQSTALPAARCQERLRCCFFF